MLTDDVTLMVMHYVLHHQKVMNELFACYWRKVPISTPLVAFTEMHYVLLRRMLWIGWYGAFWKWRQCQSTWW
jgi:hypothetical protein